MRIHLVPVGFTPEVYTNSFGPIMSAGADKLIFLHSSFETNQSRRKTEETVHSIQKSLTSIPFEKLILRSHSFQGMIEECIGLLKRFGPGDVVYLHLGGGERFVGIALLYASFFSKVNVRVVQVLEYGLDTTTPFRYEVFPSLPPYPLSSAQRKVLSLVAEKAGQKLTELARRVSPEKPERVTPSLLRQLRNLQELGFVEQDEGKTYAVSGSGKMVLLV